MAEERAVLNCPSHEGQIVSQRVNAKHGMRVILRLEAIDGKGESVREVLEDVVAATRDHRSGYEDLNSVVLLDCPLCLNEGANVVPTTRTTRRLHQGSPPVFFATVGPRSDGTPNKQPPPASHDVHIYGSEYVLIGIVYRI